METVKLIEPRVNIKHDTEKNHVVVYGGLRVNEQTNPADSWNNTQALWTINPPSTQTVTDRLMKIRCYLEITTDQDLQIGVNDAVRQFGITHLTDVLTVQINGESISDNVSDKLHAMLCYGNNAEDRNRTWSMTTAMPDNFQELSDWTDPVNGGSGKNPLAGYGENSSEQTRGGFEYEIVGPRNIRVVLTEPIMISPFHNGIGPQEEGFVNVNQFNISYRWKSDLSTLLSHSSAGNAITAVTVTHYQQPDILTTFITPNLTQPIPQLQVLHYHKTQDYIKSMAVVPAGGTTRVVSDSIKLSQIPRRLYLFCRHSRATTTFSTADSFLKITNLSILWNNQSGLFSSATSQDLFEISRRNGLNLTYPQWSKYRGSVMCIEFGKDIGLLDNEAPGVQGQYTIQIQMDLKNTSSANFTPEFFQIFSLEGTFSVFENGARASLGNLTQSAVLVSKDAEEIPSSMYDSLQGGGFWSSLKHIVNKVARGVQKVAASPITQAVVGAIPELAPVRAALPLAGRVAGSVRNATGGRLAGGRLAGGSVMSRRRRR